MADKNYNIDDILGEIRARKAQEEQTAAADAARLAAEEAAREQARRAEVAAQEETRRMSAEAAAQAEARRVAEAAIREEARKEELRKAADQIAHEEGRRASVEAVAREQAAREAEAAARDKARREAEDAAREKSRKAAEEAAQAEARRAAAEAESSSRRPTAPGTGDLQADDNGFLFFGPSEPPAPPEPDPIPEPLRPDFSARSVRTQPREEPEQSSEDGFFRKDLISEPLWEDEPPQIKPPDRRAQAAAFITGQEDSFTSLDDAPEPPQERPRSRRQTRQEPRDQDEREARGPKISVQLQSMKTTLLIRLVVNLVAMVGILYLALAPGLGLPMLFGSLSLYLWVMVGLLIISAVVSGNTVGGGIISLFTLKPSNDSYVSLSVFACLMQGSYLAMRPSLYEEYGTNLFLPMAALMLTFNTVGKLVQLSRISDSYGFITHRSGRHMVGLVDNPSLARTLASDLVEGDPSVAFSAPVKGVSRYLEQAFSPGRPEEVSRLVAPMTAGASLVMALLYYIFYRDIYRAAGVFTAALCITTPLAGVLSGTLPLSLTNRRLSQWGAIISGYQVVDQFSSVGSVMLHCSDLFPSSSVVLHSIKPFRTSSIDQVIVDAASVLCSCDSTLSDTFRDMIGGENILRDVESLSYEDRMGVSAWVGGRRVLVGNRDLMKQYGVDIPPVDYEEKYTRDGRQVLYVANSGEAAAMFILSYTADKHMTRSLELLWSRDITICVYTTDPNITEELISGLYDFPSEMIKIIPAALHPQLDRFFATKERAPAGILHNGEPSSYIRAVAAARACDSILTLETALLLLSVVVGFALITFFAFTQSLATLTWVTLALYQLFWAAIELLLPVVRK